MNLLLALLLLFQTPKAAPPVAISLQRVGSTVTASVTMAPNPKNIWLCVRVLAHDEKDFEMAHCGFADEVTKIDDPWPNMKGRFQFRAVLQRLGVGENENKATESFTSNIVEIEVL